MDKQKQNKGNNSASNSMATWSPSKGFSSSLTKEIDKEKKKESFKKDALVCGRPEMGQPDMRENCGFEKHNIEIVENFKRH